MRDRIAFGSECAEQHDCGAAQRELDEPDGGGRGQPFNNWMTGGTMFTGKLTDNGTRNSFLDTFHRSFNGLNGDWYGSQQDATVTNHFRLGIGAGE